MKPAAAKRLRLLASAVSLLALLAIMAGGWFYSRLRASLPQLDGAAKIDSLGARVTVARDALGVPTIHGENRADVARALGWLHAQERFFQMDLMRRRGAGELSELFGKAALPLDRETRMHGFRALAQKILPTLPAGERTVLDAYTQGVNAGLAALGARPFEYLVLREAPQPWRAEDTLLVLFAMWLDLQDSTGRYEHTLMTLRDQFGFDSLAFFAPLVTPGDAALDGTTAPTAPPPGPRIIDLRKRPKTSALPSRAAHNAGALAEIFPVVPRDAVADIGSNAFALAGARTATGAGLLANDMHLSLSVPNIWYRASFEFPASAETTAGKPAHKITGVTLPGAPAMIAGSNGRIAWGATVSYVDTSDLIVVEPVPGSHSLYRAAGRDEPLEIEKRKETIRVKGGESIVAEYPWTIWGPIVGTNADHHQLANHWLAYEPAASNLAWLDLENATEVDAALAIAHRLGTPEINFVVADASGKIAWTVAGALPKRVGYDGRLPTNWAFGDRMWNGLLQPDEVPVVASPASGQVWSSNQRAVGGEALAALGDGGYARAARAAQVRDDLTPLARATPRDLLAVQLDDRALFLAPWNKLLVDSLTPEAVAQKSFRGEFRALAAKWDGHASVDSVSYRLTRAFRTAVLTKIFTPIFQPCLDVDEGFDWQRLNLEPAAWTLLHDRPAHLLNPDFPSWDALLVGAVDSVVSDLDQLGVPLDRATWGARNTARIRHPFSRTLPSWLTGWLNMPADQLAGDADMPRFAAPAMGASERFVVSPGHEAEGIFHMPGGQSGHPLSPFYRAGHEAWVRGEPTPFLPGETQHTLELSP
jgi:penicillin amidase